MSSVLSIAERGEKAQTQAEGDADENWLGVKEP
jgi:hypothetical protein